MTREEKVARARQLRDEGLTYAQIGTRLGVTTTTAFRRANPDADERSRLSSLDWKARNREHVRAQNREYARRRENTGTCSRCGGPRGALAQRRAAVGTCRTCLEAEWEITNEQIVRWWADGLTGEEIAARLGWKLGALRVHMHRMRARGYDLPKRPPGGPRSARGAVAA